MRPGTFLRQCVLKPVFSRHLEEGLQILDLGGYDGSLLSKTAKRLRCTLTVLDFDSKGLLLAKENGCLTINSQIDALSLKSDSFDLVVCADVLTMVQKDQESAQEITRVLKPGGKLIATSVLEGFKLPFISMENAGTAVGGSCHAYTYEKFSELFTKNGLEFLYQKKFYNPISRFFYSLFFLLNIPSRGHKLKWKLWELIAKLDRFCQWNTMSCYLVAVKPK